MKYDYNQFGKIVRTKYDGTVIVKLNKSFAKIIPHINVFILYFLIM